MLRRSCDLPPVRSGAAERLFIRGERHPGCRLNLIVSSRGRKRPVLHHEILREASGVLEDDPPIVVAASAYRQLVWWQVLNPSDGHRHPFAGKDILALEVYVNRDTNAESVPLSRHPW
jgi:hypothetical protein